MVVFVDFFFVKVYKLYSYEVNFCLVIVINFNFKMEIVFICYNYI